MKDSSAYKTGYEVGKWIYYHPILSIVLGIIISVAFVWILTKVVKQIRTFGE